MTIQRAFTIIVASGVVLAILGALLGGIIGILFPTYYRAVFNGHYESFKPAEIGAVLGLTQEVVAGLVVGSIATLAVAISIRNRST